jgi:hypothetical protein
MNDIDRKKPRVVENLGWLDRILRFIIGTTFISVSATYLFISETTPVWLRQSEIPVWPYYLMMIAIYPMITAILGRDPLYGLFGVKSCDTSARNVCGTFPFEIDAALGHKPIPDSEIEHSLSMSHHDNKNVQAKK